jgi:DNA repair protein Rad10
VAPLAGGPAARAGAHSSSSSSAAAAAAASNPPPPLVLRKGPDATSFSEAFSLFNDAAGLGKIVDLQALAQLRAGALDAAAGGGAGGARGYAGGGGGGGSSSSSSSSSSSGAGHKLQLHVNPKQRGNPVLAHITNVWWDYVDGLGGAGGGGPDYVLGSGTAALYLSLKYHLLHPDYIHKRVRGLGKDRYKLRVLLVQVRGRGGKETAARVRRRGVWGGSFFSLAESRLNSRVSSLFRSAPQVDVEDCDKPLGELNRLALLSEYTMM